VKELLLVQPKRPNSVWRVLSLPRITGKADLLPPLSLATIAACTPEPDKIHVTIHEENLQGEIDDSFPFHAYDLVGITALVPVLPRVRELARIFRRHGRTVVVGGAGATSYPEYYRDAADVLFIGEAEKTWPRFVRDWLRGRHGNWYQQFEKVSMRLSPTPAWGLLGKERLQRYFLGALQLSRGCTNKCSFCEPVHRLGQGMRYKSIGQGMEEIRLLQRCGFDGIFLCDDNLAGDAAFLKEFLREVIAFNRALEIPLSFSTQICLNIARDDELLELLADANFKSMLVGVETPDRDALRSMNKTCNLRADIVKDIGKIHSYGMPVVPSMIVGLDSDTEETFARMAGFISANPILINCCNMFTAPPGTEAFYRLAREKRIVFTDDPSSTITNSNVIPRNMTRAELFERFIAFHQGLWRDLDGFLGRVKAYHGSITRKPRVTMKMRLLVVKYRKLFTSLAAYYLLSLKPGKVRYLFGLLRLTRFRIESLLDVYWFYIAGPFQDELHDLVVPLLENRIREEEARPPDIVDLDGYFGIVDRFTFDELSKAFPGAYPILHKNAPDMQLANELMFTVLLEFVEEFKEGFSGMEQAHLRWIERACREAVRPPGAPSPGDAAREPGEGDLCTDIIRKFKLDREIYDAVCRELRMKHTSHAPNARMQPPKA
jgi:hypothetical protein